MSTVSSKYRLLIIDDNPEICTLFKDIGEMSGYAVDCITSVSEFQEKSKTLHPTIIFLDLGFSEKDGIDILKILKDEKFTCPIVIISGHDEKIRNTASNLGKNLGLNILDSLEKPVEMKIIKHFLEKEKEAAKSNTESKEKIKSAESTELEKSVQERDFVLLFQPQVSFQTGEIVGALVFVSSKQALGSTLSIHDNKIITKPILESLFQQLSEWDLKQPFLTSINLSPKLVSDEFLNELLERCKKFEINPSQVCFNITETKIMLDTSKTIELLTKLSLKGFKLCLDDFGTEYSSMSELLKKLRIEGLKLTSGGREAKNPLILEINNLPFNKIKIDSIFINNLLNDKESYEIVSAIINMGHNIKLKVVAEGISNQESYDKLKAMGCDVAQGNFISKPIESYNFKHWIKNHTKIGSAKWKLA